MAAPTTNFPGPASENNVPERMRTGRPSVDRGFRPESKAENSFSFERATLWPQGTSLSLKGGMQKYDSTLSTKEMKLISSRVMESGEYSDLTILCEDQEFSVHKVVVCSQSKVLAAAMKKGFKVQQNPVAMAWHPLYHQDQADICSSFSGIRVQHYRPE